MTVLQDTTISHQLTMVVLTWIEHEINNNINNNKPCGYEVYPTPILPNTPYRRWFYLKNVKCSGEPKNMTALTL